MPIAPWGDRNLATPFPLSPHDPHLPLVSLTRRHHTTHTHKHARTHRAGERISPRPIPSRASAPSPRRPPRRRLSGSPSPSPLFPDPNWIGKGWDRTRRPRRHRPGASPPYVATSPALPPFAVTTPPGASRYPAARLPPPPRPRRPTPGRRARSPRVLCRPASSHVAVVPVGPPRTSPRPLPRPYTTP